MLSSAANGVVIGSSSPLRLMVISELAEQVNSTRDYIRRINRGQFTSGYRRSDLPPIRTIGATGKRRYSCQTLTHLPPDIPSFLLFWFPVIIPTLFGFAD